jgi:hypothetical protein
MFLDAFARRDFAAASASLDPDVCFRVLVPPGPITTFGAAAAAGQRYDGGGLPARAHGAEIPIEMRVAQRADMVEVHQRTYGVEGALAMARRRRGGQFDPQVVDVFVDHAEGVLAGPPPGDAWAGAFGRLLIAISG